MNAAVSGLIATAITKANAATIEDRCQTELCLAHSRGNWHDYYALQGKLRQARDVRLRPVDCGEPGFSLADLMPSFARGWVKGRPPIQ